MVGTPLTTRYLLSQHLDSVLPKLFYSPQYSLLIYLDIKQNFLENNFSVFHFSSFTINARKVISIEIDSPC